MTPAGDRFERAVILAVGSELLGTDKLDTNSLTITAALQQVGVEIRWKAIAGDDPATLAVMFRRAVEDADLVVLCGGLGPTEDDLTRDVVAEGLGLRIHEDAGVLAAIEARFARRGWTMAANNRRQAQVPEGAVALANPRGTAPGLWITRGRQGVLLLPGPPKELGPMLREAVDRFITPRTGGRRVVRRVIRMTGRGESAIDAILQPSYQVWLARAVPVRATILAAMGQIELHLTAVDGDPALADAAVDAAVAEAVAAVGRDVFSERGESLEQVVGAALASRGWRIALAESCTGGLIASRLTSVPGASRYFDQSVVTYSNEAKSAWAGVPPALIAAHGAVSDEVARAMAEGIRARTGAEVGVGVTGIAGPDGGTPGKPVGMVVMAVAHPDGTSSRTLQFPGDREQVRFQASQSALDLLRRTIGA